MLQIVFEKVSFINSVNVSFSLIVRLMNLPINLYQNYDHMYDKVFSPDHPTQKYEMNQMFFQVSNIFFAVLFQRPCTILPES